jgi:hypothetical protein
MITDALELDTFLDRNLHWLPIPRYNTITPPVKNLTEKDVTYCIKLAMLHHFINTDNVKEEEYLTTTFNCFWSLYPWLEILRDNSVPIIHHKLLVSMLAVDPLGSRDMRYVRSSFERAARSELSRMLSIDLTYTDDILAQVDTHLHKDLIKKKAKLLPPSCPEWIPWTEAKELYFVPGTSVSHVQNQIEDKSYLTGFSREYLESKCRLMNVIDEYITVGFQIDIDEATVATKKPC